MLLLANCKLKIIHIVQFIFTYSWEILYLLILANCWLKIDNKIHSFT